jgi:Fur family ferric uptake transcriptional regulator
VSTHPSALDPALIERIGALLRAHGLRRMASRIAVLAVLEPVDGHLSVTEIHQRLVELTTSGADGLQCPDLATIYRTVTTLVDRDVLHALALDGGVTTYGLAVDPHHHAVCTRCGTIIEVPAPRLTSALEHARAGSSFTLSDRAGLTLHGLCPQCQKGAHGQAREQSPASRGCPGPTTPSSPG